MNDPRSAYMNARTCICGADASDHRCPEDPRAGGFDPDWDHVCRYFEAPPASAGAWYLAHPVSPDDRYSFADNMAHALEIARICHDAGFKVCLPWYADCLYLDDTNAEHRAAGLAMDADIAAQMGRIILTGHRLSSGMQNEAAGVELAGGVVLDAVGVPDDELAEHLRTKVFSVG